MQNIESAERTNKQKEDERTTFNKSKTIGRTYKRIVDAGGLWTRTRTIAGRTKGGQTDIDLDLDKQIIYKD